MLRTKVHQNGIGLGVKSDIRSLTADVILGVLRKNCRGLGICKIVPEGILSMECSVTRVTLEKRSGDVLRIDFDPSLICKVQWHRQFSRGVFTLEEHFMLPDFVNKDLKLEKRAIGKGEYIVIPDQDHYYVDFELSRPEDLPNRIDSAQIRFVNSIPTSQRILTA